MDKGRHVVKLAAVDMWRVRPIKKQKERNGPLTVWTHTWTERVNQGAEGWKASQNPQILMAVFTDS